MSAYRQTEQFILEQESQIDLFKVEVDESEFQDFDRAISGQQSVRESAYSLGAKPKPQKSNLEKLDFDGAQSTGVRTDLPHLERTVLSEGLEVELRFTSPPTIEDLEALAEYIEFRCRRLKRLGTAEAGSVQKNSTELD